MLGASRVDVGTGGRAIAHWPLLVVAARHQRRRAGDGEEQMAGAELLLLLRLHPTRLHDEGVGAAQREVIACAPRNIHTRARAHVPIQKTCTLWLWMVP
eukprot:COSAG05_NODE_1697_length_4258_cov_7.337822_10_plen_99_part_00